MAISAARAGYHVYEIGTGEMGALKPSTDLELDWQLQTDAAGVPSSKEMARWVKAALVECQRSAPVQMTIRVVDEEEIRSLNRQYRHKNAPTNVLSFPFEDPPGVHTNILGDIVICAAVVEREARELAIPPLAHWAHMVVHGVLHLCGYDHVEEGEAELMESTESRVLAGFGFFDPYA
jgi:probable rRNA maturation factor